MKLLHSLKWRNPSEWSIVSNLMCDKMNAPVWSIIQAVFKKVTHHGDYKSDKLVVGHGMVMLTHRSCTWTPGFRRRS